MNRRVLLIAGAAALAVVAVWYVALWSPQSSSLKKAAVRVDTAEQQQSTLQTQLQALQKSKKDLPAQKAQLDALKAAIPDQPHLDQVLATVNDAAKGANVSVTNLSPAPIATTKPGATGAATRTGSGLPEVRVTLNASGSYFQLTDFIKRLSAAPRLVVLDSVSFSGTGDVMTTALTGRMFAQPSAVPAPAAPASGAATGGTK